MPMFKQLSTRLKQEQEQIFQQDLILYILTSIYLLFKKLLTRLNLNIRLKLKRQILCPVTFKNRENWSKEEKDSKIQIESYIERHRKAER